MQSTKPAGIGVACPCGAKMRAKPELAGRTVKCPKCGEKLTIAAPPPTPAEPPPLTLEPPARRGLDGLSPDYRINLKHWLAAANPHFGPITGPAIGYFFVFGAMLAAVILLHFLVIGFVLDPILTPALAIGFHVVCQCQLKGKPWTFGTFFSGFRWVWPLAGRAMLLGVPAVAAALVFFVVAVPIGFAFDGEPPAVAVGFLAAVMAGLALGVIYVTVRLVFFSHFLIIDRGCGPVDALKGSWILTRGHFWGILGTMLAVLGVVYLSGFLTLGIGMLFTLPRAIMFLNAGYLLIAGSEPLPGRGYNSEKEERKGRPRSWVSLAACAAGLLLFGTAVGISSHFNGPAAQRAKDAEMKRKHDQEYAKRAAAYKSGETKTDDAGGAGGPGAGESRFGGAVQFFREGGVWSYRLPRRDEDGGKWRVLVLGPQFFPRGRAAVPFAAALVPDYDVPGAGGAAAPPLVDVRKQRGGPGSIGSATSAGAAGGASMWADDVLALSTAEPGRRQEFNRQFAAALQSGGVTAVLVTTEPLAPDERVPLADAETLTRERFVELTEERIEVKP